MRRREGEAGCCGLLITGPTAGDWAQSARDLLPVDKEPQGTEPHDGFRQDPVIVKSLWRQKPERIAAFGLVLLVALLLWRLMERAMRRHVDTTSAATTGHWPARSQRSTPLSDRPRRAGHLWPAARRLTDNSDGRPAPLTTAKADPAMVRGGPPAYPWHAPEQSSGPGAGRARGQGPHQS
jgi:hypothetical protein